MIYLDTNLLVPFFVPERNSSHIRDWARDQETVFCVSIWSRVEFRSVLGLKVRIGELTQRQADDSHETFEQSFLPSLKEWPIERRHFLRSIGLLKSARSGLRGPDALHLAVCLDAEGVTLATSDATLFKAAKAVHQRAAFVGSSARS